jgi:hypothetical protein
MIDTLCFPRKEHNVRVSGNGMTQYALALLRKHKKCSFGVALVTIDQYSRLMDVYLKIRKIPPLRRTEYLLRYNEI